MALFLIGFFTLSIVLRFANGQIVHSVSRMDLAIQSRGKLAGHLREYLDMEHKRLFDLELLINEIPVAVESQQMNETELEEKFSNPINVLRLITKLYTETENIRSTLVPTEVPQVVKTGLDSLTTKEDYTNAMRSILRLQDTYQEQADFTRPKDGIENVLTAKEVFEVAKTALEDGNTPLALENMKRAKEMFADEGDMSNSMLSYDYLAILMYQQGNIEHALNYTYEMLDYYLHTEFNVKTADRLKRNVKGYKEKLGWDEDEEEMEVLLTEPYVNEPDTDYDNYMYHALCRGERIQIDGIADSKLSCYLQDNGDPRLLLAPARVEELSAEAGLSFYHNVLSDNEINLLRKLAAVKFKDSTLAATAANRLNQKVRSSNTGWVQDTEDDKILAISRRISVMTGLDLTHAEAFQVLSYGVGGFYRPHYDYLYREDVAEQRIEIQFPKRDRIATWIFYLNDVEEGGATVFPELGATVWPEKGGAAFWYNLYRNGTGNPYTFHAACPVLKGYKWASNKWFHEGGNELARPCDLNEKL